MIECNNEIISSLHFFSRRDSYPRRSEFIIKFIEEFNKEFGYDNVNK